MTPIPRSSQCSLGSRYARRPAGATLVELIMSMAIMSVLLGAMGSAIFLSTKAFPSADDTTVNAIAAARVADQLIGELEVAKSFTVLTATAVEFTVADRGTPPTGDETIRYEWSGTPGDPLTRQYNGGTIVNVLDSVEQFALDYNIESTAQAPPGVEGPEVLLSSFDGSFTWQTIEASDWYGQYIQPSLPADAISWRVSRVSVYASKQGATSGVVKFQLRTADTNNLPTATVLEEQLFYESSLGAQPNWNEFSFTTVTNRSPDEGLCLVLESNTGDSAMNIYFNQTTPSGLLTTTNAGSSWNNDGSKVLLHYVYGHVSTPDPAWIPPGLLRSVRVTLNTTQDGRSRIETAALVLNTPEITP